MRKLTTIAILAMALCLVLGSVALALTGSEVLKKVDDVINAPKDQTYNLTMTLISKSGQKKVKKAKMWQKGDKLRLVKFSTVPKDNMLLLPNDVIYHYSSEFRKIRRIAAHVKNQNFAGSDLTFDDMSTTRFSDDYDAELSEETDTHYVLKLTPKSGVKKEYGMLKMWVLKSNFYMEKIEFYSKAGKLLKTQHSKDITQISGYWVAKRMEVINAQDEHRTILELNDVQYDTGLSDDIFTQRNLKRD